MPLELVLTRYYAEHGSKVPAQPTIKRSLALWSEHFAGAAVAEVGPTTLDSFVTSLRAKGYSDGYVSTVLSSGRAALNRARKRGELAAVPFIPDVQTAADKLDKVPKGRPLTIEEMASLIEHAPYPWFTLFVVISGNTLARPGAVTGLSPFQRDAGVLNLNPAGRKQTKKFRPALPVTRTLAAWLGTPTAGTFVHNSTGRAISRTILRRNFQRAATAAKLAPGSAPYSIRHTMGRELRRRGVPRDQISGFLGHVRASTTDIYAPYDPGYLAEAVAAIDAYWDEVFAILLKRGVRFALQARVTGGVKLLQGS